MKKVISLFAAMVLSMAVCIPASASTAASLPTLSQIETANSFNTWHYMYKTMGMYTQYYNADGALTFTIQRITGSDASGPVYFYSDSHKFSAYFSGNLSYDLNDGVTSAELFLKNLVLQMKDGITGSPLVYSDDEKIVSETRDGNGDITIISEIVPGNSVVEADETIDVNSFDKISFVTVVDGKKLLFKSSSVYGIKGDQRTLLNTSTFNFSAVDQNMEPAYVTAMKNAADKRTITIVMTSGDTETFTVPMGCGVYIQAEDGYDTYADENYAEIDDSDPERLNRDRTLYYLPVQ